MAKKILIWLDQNIENALIFPMYFLMMAIMAIGVVQRFVFKTSFHWAVYVCIGLFVWFSWLGCSWNVKERAHLRLAAFRNKLPRNVQFGLLDARLFPLDRLRHYCVVFLHDSDRSLT